MKQTIIFTILLLLCSCGDKSSEDKSEQCGIGKYVYVDWYNKLYDKFSADGVSLPDYDTFEKFMSKPANRRKFYEACKADGAVTSPTYEEFMRKLTGRVARSSR